MTGLPWVWRSPWGSPWAWVWIGYGDRNSVATAAREDDRSSGDDLAGARAVASFQPNIGRLTFHTQLLLRVRYCNV